MNNSTLPTSPTKTILIILFIISIITAVMKLKRGAMWTWFEHQRTPLKTSSFFMIFALLLLYCILNLEKYCNK